MPDDLDQLASFHNVGKLFPGETQVLTISPDMRVVDALGLIVEHRYSQLPVVHNGKVRGVFSVWSLARQVITSPEVPFGNLVVEDVMEILPTLSVEDSLHSVLLLLKQHDAILVDSPQGLQAIATPIDVLNYFYRIARPFLLLGEIERSLRSLITVSAPGEKLQECIDRSIAKMYTEQKRPVPTSLDKMTFEDYRGIIIAKENWPLFQGTLGRNRDLVVSKLEKIRVIRNGVFHFREDITLLDHETLAAAREWLLDKARMAKREGVST